MGTNTFDGNSEPVIHLVGGSPNIITLIVKDHTCTKNSHTFCLGYFEGTSHINLQLSTLSNIKSSIDLFRGSLNKGFEIRHLTASKIDIDESNTFFNMEGTDFTL